ncbi:hypothetical protein BJ508DRAFT_315478 [Ascobolus immersus RN42]|uniref:Uncharacterized protein n=1 Tax=Ascobolus immersus RN42 TaxID=1160509 RepID=A0A3N4HFC9_ASCIM|nr:hypothetical protein BJ508DRAFT_315478 [Ascobolus immersus RN42]
MDGITGRFEGNYKLGYEAVDVGLFNVMMSNLKRSVGTFSGQNCKMLDNSDSVQEAGLDSQDSPTEAAFYIIGEVVGPSEAFLFYFYRTRLRIHPYNEARFWIDSEAGLQLKQFIFHLLLHEYPYREYTLERLPQVHRNRMNFIDLLRAPAVPRCIFDWILEGFNPFQTLYSLSSVSSELRSVYYPLYQKALQEAGKAIQHPTHPSPEYTEEQDVSNDGTVTMEQEPIPRSVAFWARRICRFPVPLLRRILGTQNEGLARPTMESLIACWTDVFETDYFANDAPIMVGNMADSQEEKLQLLFNECFRYLAFVPADEWAPAQIPGQPGNPSSLRYEFLYTLNQTLCQKFASLQVSQSPYDLLHRDAVDALMEIAFERIAFGIDGGLVERFNFDQVEREKTFFFVLNKRFVSDDMINGALIRLSLTSFSSELGWTYRNRIHEDLMFRCLRYVLYEPAVRAERARPMPGTGVPLETDWVPQLAQLLEVVIQRAGGWRLYKTDQCNHVVDAWENGELWPMGYIGDTFYKLLHKACSPQITPGPDGWDTDLWDTDLSALHEGIRGLLGLFRIVIQDCEFGINRLKEALTFAA